MKKIGVIGATGFVGTALVKELLNRGYAVKALARNIDKLEQHQHLEAVSVSVTDVDALATALADVAAVISTFNPGWSDPHIYNNYLLGARAIEQAVEKAGVKRLIVVGGAGSLFTADGTQLVDGDGFPEAIKPGAMAARDYLNEIRKNTSLDWTFFSPAIEMHPGTAGVRKGVYRTGLENPVVNEEGRSILSVEDVAVVLTDELENGLFIQKRFTAAY